MFYFVTVPVIPLQHRSCFVCMSFVRLGHHKGDCLAPRWETALSKCLSEGHIDALPHRESKQGFANFQYYAAFTLRRFDDQKRNLTFVKTAFQVLKLQFLACSMKQAFYQLHNQNIARDWQQESNFLEAFLSVPGCQTCMYKRGITLLARRSTNWTTSLSCYQLLSLSVLF